MKDYKDYKPRGNKKHRAGKRLITPKVLKSVAIIIFFAASLIVCRQLIRNFMALGYFDLTEIRITGNSAALEDELIALSMTRAGDNIWKYSLEEVQNRIANHPWVKNVSVKRALPGLLMIHVTERIPVAVIVDKGDMYYVDRDGNPFIKVHDPGDNKFVPIYGVRLKEVKENGIVRDALINAVSFVADESAGWPEEPEINRLDIDVVQGLTVSADQLSVKMGTGDYHLKIDRMKKVLKNLKSEGRKASYIDLTYRGQVVVTPESRTGRDTDA